MQRSSDKRIRKGEKQKNLIVVLPRATLAKATKIHKVPVHQRVGVALLKSRLYPSHRIPSLLLANIDTALTRERSASGNPGY